MSEASNISAASLHQEHVFEAHIVQSLVAHQEYIERASTPDYDAATALAGC